VWNNHWGQQEERKKLLNDKIVSIARTTKLGRHEKWGINLPVTPVPEISGEIYGS
jgi:hypothetical protein